MGREDKKEPISDLTTHNLKREEVRAATKRLDEYLITKYDLNKTKSAREVPEEKTEKEKSKTSEAKEGDQTAKMPRIKMTKKRKKRIQQKRLKNN